MKQNTESKLERFVPGENRAVSPVVGVVLMVAITVILAAAVASFVLGLSNVNQEIPQASFSCDDGAVTMDSGETLDPDTVYVDGKKWSNRDPDIGSGITAGETITQSEVPSDGVITWESTDGDTSATLFDGC